MLALTDATVTFSSPGGPFVRAVDGVTLTIPAGQFVVVVGTNGSGKSTLLGAIAGTVGLDSGRIELAAGSWPATTSPAGVSTAGRRSWGASSRTRGPARPAA